MNLEEFAGLTRELAERASGSLAHDCAAAAAKEYLAALFVTTPVLSGDLRASEKINAVSGGGPVAVADVGPDIIYDKFRNDGGTIRVKRAKVLTDGTRFFGKQVTQRGSHYMERAAAEAEGTMAASMQEIVATFLTL